MPFTTKFSLPLIFIALVNAASAQEIALEQDVPIMIGGSYYLGSRSSGSNLVAVFKIHNPGNVPLNLTGTPRVTVSGPNAADFVVTTQPNSTVQPSGRPVVLTNGGFEYPAYAPGVWILSPPGAGWTFGFSSGICRNGSVWHTNAAPEGKQSAFIHTDGAGAFISRTLYFPSKADFLIRFKLVRRGSGFEANDIDVRMDGATLGTISNTNQFDDVWRSFEVPYSCTNAGDHTLSFVGVRGGGDYASCLDDVQILHEGGESFTITVTPPAAGLSTATLSIPNDSANNPFTAVISAGIPPVRIGSPSIVNSNIFRFTAEGPTNVQYFKVYGTNVLTSNPATWPLLAVGDSRQTSFDIAMPWTNGGFFFITTNYYDTQQPIPVVFTHIIRQSSNTIRFTTNTLAMSTSTETAVFTLKLDNYKNFFNAQIVGDFTNHYSYDWRVDVIGGDSDYTNQGMTGYLTPTLEITKNSLPDGFDVEFHFTITRLADEYSTEYILHSHIINSQLDPDMIMTCQQASTACNTCECIFAVALPTTEPH